eukprot:symbB.v1.2.041503.t1/scaffold8287.1/size6955/1
MSELDRKTAEALSRKVEGGIQNFEPQQLAACAWALTTTSYRSRPWLQVLSSAAMQTASWPLLGVVTWSLASAEEKDLLEAVEFEFGPGWGG